MLVDADTLLDALVSDLRMRVREGAGWSRVGERSTTLDMYGGTMWIGWLMMLIPIAALALLVVLVAMLVRGGRAGGRDDGALEILQRRYARGEIEPDEFTHVRATLLSRPR